MSSTTLGFTPAQELIREQEDKTLLARSTFIVLIPLSVISVLLRFLSRRIARSRIWWDDYLIVVALVFSIGLNVDLLLGVAHGLGQHAEFAGIKDVVYGAKVSTTYQSGWNASDTKEKVEYAAELIYQLAMTCVKLAILLFYYRLFNVNNRFVIAIFVVGTVTLCWYFTSTFIIIFQCRPVNYMWTRVSKPLPGGWCIPQEELWTGSSVTSLITDVAVLCLPVPIIWKFSATAYQKVALSGVFLLGAFGEPMPTHNVLMAWQNFAPEEIFGRAPDLVETQSAPGVRAKGCRSLLERAGEGKDPDRASVGQDLSGEHRLTALTCTG
ncbi:uncharacterized protein KY384_006472 [Bacidia gigantensis]|uniref:uncharacterized protein n=1 Tax=Bacidia gigantensis TaxID=2732470 RepID=UPI001D059390|nr:uncharacterized protein KY384_006472 [Bacidia gigantensis]KAG8528784.1 hypothetical protein KY384_006472 [Bacidia gigantensis]